MLYDPKWERPSLAGFKAWLERQNPDETFNYGNCDKCAVGQYLEAMGTSWHTAEDHMVTRLNRFATMATRQERTIFPTFGAVLREIEFAEAL